MSVNRKISNLPAVTGASILDADIIPLVASGVTSKTTIADLRVKLGFNVPAGGRTVTDPSTYFANNAVFNVKDFGAFGDNSHNDVTAVNAAITAASVAGGIVYFPPGIYVLNAAITIAHNGVVVRGSGRINTVLAFTGATDGVVLADAISLQRVVLEDFTVQTSNAGGLKAIKADFHTAGGPEHIIRNIAIDRTGSGRWTHGFFGNNFQTSALYNVKVLQSATVGFRFENFCNATNVYNCEVVGSSGVGTITRAVEVINTLDLFWFGGTFQGYFTQALLYTDASGIHAKGIHFENTNVAPSDGADIVINAGINSTFNGVQGGSMLVGVGAGVVRNVTIMQSEFGAVTFGTAAGGCGIGFSRVGSITDNTGGSNWFFANSNAVGTVYANKIPGQIVSGNVSVIPTYVNAPAAALLLANARPLSGLDSTGAVKDLLFISGADQTFLQFLNVLTIRDTANVPYAQMTSSVWRIIAGLNQQQESSNGAIWRHGQLSELLTLSTGGATTDTVGNLLPADAIIEAVVARVTTTITTATDWKLGDATTAGRFSAANAVMTAGTTQVGTVHADQTGAAGPRQTAAAKVRVTTTGTPGAGAIRITVYYRQLVAPTS